MFKKKIILCSNISESEKLKSLALFNETSVFITNPVAPLVYEHIVYVAFTAGAEC